MTELVEQHLVEAEPDRSRRRQRWWIAVVVALVCAVCLSVVAFAFRYSAARSLSNEGGGYSWAAPDNLNEKFVQLGRYNGLVVPVRPGQVQSFYFEIRNDAPVAQTVLGLADASLTTEPESLAVATRSDYRLNQASLRYQSGPITLPPHSDRFVRMSVNVMTCPGWSSRDWQSVRLRVRVGAFTRIQTVRLGTTIFELSHAAAGC